MECLYQSGDHKGFKKQFSKFQKLNPIDINLAALSDTIHKLRNEPDPYPFCPNPLGYLKTYHLSDDFPEWRGLINDVLTAIDSMELIWEPKFKATIGGEQTDNSLFSINERSLSILKEVIHKKVQYYFKYFKDNRALYIKNHPSTIQLQAWFVRMNEGGFQQSHIHASGWISGIIYLKTIDDPLSDQGAIDFGRANYDFMPENTNQEVVLYKPKIGDIIFFPSSLFHRTIPINSKKERCIISFDIFPTKRN